MEKLTARIVESATKNPVAAAAVIAGASIFGLGTVYALSPAKFFGTSIPKTPRAMGLRSQMGNQNTQRGTCMGDFVSLVDHSKT